MLCSVEYTMPPGSASVEKDLPMVQSKESENNNHVFFRVSIE